MRAFSVLVALSASFLMAGQLDAQAFRNPDRVPTAQDPISVFTVDVNGDGVPDLLYETEGGTTAASTMSIFFGQSSGGYTAGPTLTLPGGVGGCRPLDANRDGKIDLACLRLMDEYDVEAATLLGNGDGTFQAPIYSAPMQSEVGINAFAGWIFTPADVNSDGIPDLLVGDAYDEWIFVLLGDGTGKYTVKTILGGHPISEISGFTADAAMSITVTDLNGDGKPDLAFSNGPTVFLGNGDGTFQGPNTYVGNYDSCVFHDMDGDGHPDAVCVNIPQGFVLAILHGNADGSFNTTPTFSKTYLQSDAPWPAYILDLNGDGIPDILATSSDGLEVLLGGPGLTFANPVHYAVGYPASNGEQSSQLTDMNGDGYPDVVAAGPNGIYISFGNAEGTFNTAPAYEIAKALGHVAVTDFNGDGIPDIVASGDPNIELSLGNGDGTFKPYTAIPNGGIDFSTNGTPSNAALVHGDFRGNGKQDILAIGSPTSGAYDPYLLFGNGDGTFASPLLVPNIVTGFSNDYSMIALDINMDGRDDILTMDATTIYASLSNGDGTFTTISTAIPVNNRSGTNPSFPVFADFNKDGHLDAAYGLSNSVQVLNGHGDGTFDTTGVNLAIPAYLGVNPITTPSAQVASGDFDGDGNPDIAVLAEIVQQVAPWTNQILTVAYVYYGNGDGSFSSPIVAGAFNREYAGIFAADVNKDGLSDLILQTDGTEGVLASPSGDALGVLLSSPGRVFGPEVNYTGGSLESGLLIGDLNGDGYPDLLAINRGFFPDGDFVTQPPNTVTELLNVGGPASSGLLPTSTILRSSSNPAVVGTPITFTATVSAVTAGNGAPTGSVTFTDQTGINETEPLSAVNSSQASATLTTSAIGIASDVVRATYSGDTVFAASSGSVTQAMNGFPVTIGFSAAPNTVAVGQTVTLTANVANPTGNSVPAPTGSITFSDGATNLSGPIPLTAGTATYNTSFSVAGTQTLTATYSGDALHDPTSITINVQVQSGSPVTPTPMEWVWIGGSDSVAGNCNQYGNCGPVGVYGAKGTPAAANVPGGRSGGFTWVSGSGNPWLFGGQGFDASGNLGELNDLWEFAPAIDQWVWMGGSSTINNNCSASPYCGSSGVYGTLRTVETGTIPGSRQDGATWTDKNGNLWLFGGFGSDAIGDGGYLNDLWEFNPSTLQWVWMSGSNILGGALGQPGVYGTLGTPAAGNVPGARAFTTSWTDPSGHLWLFGGVGIDANGALGFLNDVWSFDPSTDLWTWMGGSSTVGNVCGTGADKSCGRPGVYGTLGAPAAGNIPSGRQQAAAWTDSSGHAWLFGGIGFDSAGSLGALNDLWEFNPSTNQWTWMGGSSTIANNNGAGQPTVYGTLGVPAAGNNPGGHYGSAHWVDGSGNLWLFGGEFIVASGGSMTVNDQWEFNPATNEWTWWGGSSTQYVPAVYGTLGVAAPGNFPGARGDAMAWSNSSGNVWLFGGGGYDVNDRPGSLNDLWSYQPSTALPAAATPTFTPPAGSYTAAQTVTISDATPGATIYYTTNGTTPTTSSSVYSAGIAVSSSETIEAIATASGYANSAVATATYTITLPIAATPTFNPPAGSYAAAQSVTISDATPGATIYYTTDGSTPTTSSSVYSAGIVVAQSETLNAIATATGYTASAVGSAAYTITLPTTTTLTASPNPASFGTAVTFTATVSNGTAIPVVTTTAVSVGKVSFYDGSVLLATKALTSSAATYSTSALSVGSHSITAVYTAGAGFSNSTSNTVVEVILAADFAISASPGAQTIYEGEATSYQITVTPGVGFNLPVALSCTQLPANTTCKFSPATVSGGSGSATLTVQSSAPSKAAKASALTMKVGVPVLAGVLLIFIPRRLRRSGKGWYMFLALLLSIALGAAAMTGCGGPGSLTGGTPVGADTVTITGVATNGSQTLMHATTVTLNVKSLF